MNAKTVTAKTAAAKTAKTAETVKIPLCDFGKAAGGDTLSVPGALFARAYTAAGAALVHQILTSVLSNARTATRKQKTRAEVHHTTRKLFRQKGTGRARGGHSSTPLRRGGGRAFPASPADNFQRKLSRKMYRLAVALILSQLAREERLLAVRGLAGESHKTKDFCKKLAAMKLGGAAGKSGGAAAGKILLVDTVCDDKLLLASRNLPGIRFLPVTRVLPTDLVAADKILVTEQAVEKIAAQFGGGGAAGAAAGAAK